MEELQKILEQKGKVEVSPAPVIGNILTIELEGYTYHFLKDGEVIRYKKYKWYIENGKLVVK